MAEYFEKREEAEAYIRRASKRAVLYARIQLHGSEKWMVDHDRRNLGSSIAIREDLSDKIGDIEKSGGSNYEACPNCRATDSPYGADVALRIYRCSCDKVYCDKCSAGGLVSLPRCPVSAYHEGMRNVGEIRPRAAAKPAATDPAPSPTDQGATRPSEARSDLSAKQTVSLFEAAKRGDLRQVNEALVDKPDLEQKTANMTPLQVAAWHGHAEIVERLLAAGASVNAVDSDDWTPLHYAAKGDNSGRLPEAPKKRVAQMLMAVGAKVNALSKSRTGLDGRHNPGVTPLDVARGWDYHAIAAILKPTDTPASGTTFRDEPKATTAPATERTSTLPFNKLAARQADKKWWQFWK